jgi:hypothetical protein
MDDLKKLELTPEQVIEILKANSHTGHKSIVGGLRPSCPDNPEYWRGVREVWFCPEDCPACERSKKTR